MPCRNNAFGCKYYGSGVTASHATNCAFYACLWRNNGCGFTGTKAAIGMHERACDFAVVYCLLRDSGCQFTCQRRDLPKHFESCIRRKEVENARMMVDAKKPLHVEDRKSMMRQKNIIQLQERAQQILDDKPVMLNVGGHEIMTSLRLLCRYPSSVLGLLASGMNKSEQRPLRLFLDRDPDVIENVLTFLRYGRLPPQLTVQEHALLQWEAEYLGLTELTRALKIPAEQHMLVPVLELEIQGNIARSLL